MSYILEALKKAQAERQLGSAPTIHAPTVHAIPAGRANRTPVVIGIAAGVLVLAAAALFTWRQQIAAPVPAPAPQGGAAPVANGAPQPVAAPVPAIAPPPVESAAPSAPAPQVALLGDPEPAHKAAPVPARPKAPALASPAATPVQRTVPAAEHGDVVAARPTAAVPAPAVPPPVAAEEAYRMLGELPEPVRRELPKVAVGGYIYSPNPAERLLLIDKVLRREGEEVAPGLVLEKLLPKAALMNYKGFRYRVPY
jgi:general secretion pathway protein B